MTRSGRSASKARICLIVRHARSGAVKTRIAAERGDDFALALHDRLTRHVLARMLALQACGEAAAEVRTDASFQHASREWLSGRAPRRRRPAYRYQGEGSLGRKLYRAFAEAFGRKDERVLVIGADCPRLTAAHLREALAALAEHDCVFGPAADGGYWLVGVRRSAAARALPALFDEQIAWGGADVLAATLERAQAAELSVHLLETLPDTDRPEDVADAEAALAADIVTPDSAVSVVIPAIDEADSIADAIASARAGGASEVVVADGGSADATRDIARAAGALVVEAPRGRAHQMNAGAAAASGTVLCFLHADTRLPTGFAAAAREALARPGAAACAFDFAVPADARHARLITLAGRLRYRLSGIPYGDQGVCVPRGVFESLGGFAELPTMEDLELGHRLDRMGRIERAAGTAVTSARAWEEHGLVRPTLVNAVGIAAFRLGVSPQRIARWRRRIAR